MGGCALSCSPVRLNIGLLLCSQGAFSRYRQRASYLRLIRPTGRTTAVSCNSKHLSGMKLEDAHILGYSAPGQEKVSQHVYDDKELQNMRTKTPDVKESFESGREDDECMPNIWLPDGVLPGFKEACLDFFWVRRTAAISWSVANRSAVLSRNRAVVPESSRVGPCRTRGLFPSVSYRRG